MKRKLLDGLPFLEIGLKALTQKEESEFTGGVGFWGGLALTFALAVLINTPSIKTLGNKLDQGIQMVPKFCETGYNKMQAFMHKEQPSV